MKNYRLGFIIMFFVAALSCAPAKMRVPEDVLVMKADLIVAAERKAASGTLVNESFKLNPYTITDVDRDWDSTKHLSVWTFSKETKTSGYTYLFKTPSGDLNGNCQIEGRSKSATSFSGVTMSSQVSKIGCACKSSETNIAQTVLDSENDSKYQGQITLRDNTSFKIQAIYEVDGAALSTGNPSGYRVDGETVKAAVEVMHPGKIWLSKDLSNEQRDDLSCIFAGLMLYRGKKVKDDF